MKLYDSVVDHVRKLTFSDMFIYQKNISIKSCLSDSVLWYKLKKDNTWILIHCIKYILTNFGDTSCKLQRVVIVLRTKVLIYPKIKNNENFFPGFRKKLSLEY